MKQIHQTLIMSGSWVYGDSDHKEVHIVKSNFKAGSGDYEDEPKIREDQYGEFYGVRIGVYPSTNPLHGGDYETLNEAIEYVTKTCPSLKWNIGT